MNVFLAVLRKDLLIEWRSRDRVVAMLLFALLVVVIFQFALPGGVTPRTRENAPGLLWVAYVFASLFGLGRAFSLVCGQVGPKTPISESTIHLSLCSAIFLTYGLVPSHPTDPNR